MKKICLLCLVLSFSAHKVAATEWITYFVYYVDSVDSYYQPDYFLRPVAYNECLSFSIELQTHSIMHKLMEHSPVFEYEEIEESMIEEEFEDATVTYRSLTILLKTNELSYVERQSVITSILIHGYDNVVLSYSDGHQESYDKEDIKLPFYLPLYFPFDAESYAEYHFIKNAAEFIHLIYEQHQRTFDANYDISELLEVLSPYMNNVQPAENRADADVSTGNKAAHKGLSVNKNDFKLKIILLIAMIINVILTTIVLITNQKKKRKDQLNGAKIANSNPKLPD